MGAQTMGCSLLSLRATLRDAWLGLPAFFGMFQFLVTQPIRLNVDVLLLFIPFDRLDVDCDLQIHDSRGLTETCFCGHVGVFQEILREKQHPAAVQVPRVIQI